jgi:hypothetical protein
MGMSAVGRTLARILGCLERGLHRLRRAVERAATRTPNMTPGKFWVSVGDFDMQLGRLDPHMDAAFTTLYESILTGSQPNALDFDNTARAFFDQHLANATLVNAYFNNFTQLWALRLDQGHLLAAAALWDWALRPALAWEVQHTRQLHKGTPFYFAGMTAILARDLDGGYLLMHRALEEDIRTSGTPSPPTPAYAFVVMDAVQEQQAFRAWVLEKAALVTARLDEYRSKYGRSLDFASFRLRFLMKAQLRDEVFLFSHSVARVLYLKNLPPYLLLSDFAGQLCANLLFEVALVVDACIHQKHPSEWKFIKLAAHLSAVTGLGLSEKHLGEINGRFDQDFAGTTAALLDETLTLNDGTRPSGLSAALALTYGVRNRGAHNVTAVKVVRERFSELVRALLETLFAAIEVLH